MLKTNLSNFCVIEKYFQNSEHNDRALLKVTKIGSHIWKQSVMKLCTFSSFIYCTSPEESSRRKEKFESTIRSEAMKQQDKLIMRSKKIIDTNSIAKI